MSIVSHIFWFFIFNSYISPFHFSYLFFNSISLSSLSFLLFFLKAINVPTLDVINGYKIRRNQKLISPSKQSSTLIEEDENDLASPSRVLFFHVSFLIFIMIFVLYFTSFFISFFIFSLLQISIFSLQKPWILMKNWKMMIMTWMMMKTTTMINLQSLLKFYYLFISTSIYIWIFWE